MKAPRLRAARPGRRAKYVVVKAAYGGGVVGTLGAVGWGLLVAESKLARRTIGEPTQSPLVPDGRYGKGRGAPLRFALLGDSSAAGLGVAEPFETTGAQLAGGLARELARPVDLTVVAAVGGRSADLDAQAGAVLSGPLDLVIIMVGTNDVTHRVPVSSASRDLGRVVRTLREAGAAVVVGTCPDLGTVQPLLQPLKSIASVLGRRLAAAQTVAVVEAGGVAVTLGDLLSPEFALHPNLWGPDRFHPSAAGYARVAETLLPSCLEALGHPVAGSEPVRDSVQDVEVAALVAARTPGLEVETVHGGEGAASAGPGRLARLRRRRPLVGRAAPEQRSEPASNGPVRPDRPDQPGQPGQPDRASR